MRDMTPYIVGIALFVFLVVWLFWYWLAHYATCRGDLKEVKSPLIIFDFDGTICPSYKLFVEQVNFFSHKYNLRRIEEHEIEDFRNMHPKTALKTLRVSLFLLPVLLHKARQNVRSHLLELKPVPGIAQVLSELSLRGFSLGILTSNSQENVIDYLKKYELDFFDFIYTAKNAFGKEKHLKAILKKTGLNLKTSRVAYVGDEYRDMIAAHKAQLKSVAVTWGYNSKKLLMESKPDILCDDPRQLLYL